MADGTPDRIGTRLVHAIPARHGRDELSSARLYQTCVGLQHGPLGSSERMPPVLRIGEFYMGSVVPGLESGNVELARQRYVRNAGVAGTVVAVVHGSDARQPGGAVVCLVAAAGIDRMGKVLPGPNVAPAAVLENE